MARAHLTAPIAAIGLLVPAAVLAGSGLAAGGLRLVVVGDYASSWIMELRDREGRAVAVPPAVARSLDGPSPVMSLSPDSCLLAFGEPDTVRIYDPGDGTIRTVFACDTLYQGCSNALWSGDGARIAFVQVDRELLPMTTRLVVIDLSGTPGRRTFDVRMRYSVGSMTTSDAGCDFWFASTDRICYYTWVNSNYDPDSAKLLRSVDLGAAP